jgi:hypothetical protein
MMGKRGRLSQRSYDAGLLMWQRENEINKGRDEDIWGEVIRGRYEKVKSWKIVCREW